jgi:hypothetical protein
LLVLRQDKLELYQLRLKKKYWELDSAPIIKTNCFLWKLETVDNTSPATTWTSTGSPHLVLKYQLLHFNKCKIFPHSCKKLGYTTGPWEIMMPKGFLKVSC